MQHVLEELSPYLATDDDPSLWLTVLRVVNGDISRRFTEAESARDLLLLVGPCSNWLRPHQTRFRVRDEEFAWPSGYGGVGFSRTGLPSFDWCCCYRRIDDSHFARIDVPHKVNKRQLLVRVAIPTQTMGRRKASINVMWTPGTPDDPRQPIVRLLAFKKNSVQWALHGEMTRGGESWAGELIPPPNKRMQRIRR